LRACSVNLRFAAWCLAAVGIPGVLSAQPDPASLRPVRGHAEERHVIALTFRDWSPATVAGNTVLAGVATGGGGLFAFDATTGRRKWSFIPTFSGGTAHLTSPPAVAGDVVIAPFGAAHAGAFIAVSLTTGKELWRGPAPLLRAEVVVEGGIAYLQVAPGEIQAVDVATGRVQWRLPIATDRVPCGGAPVVRDGTVYLKTNLPVMAPDRRLSTYHVMALDARTGEERWRYRPAAPYVHSGVCVGRLVVTADAVLAYGESHLYSVDRASGRERFAPIEFQRKESGKVYPVEMQGLTAAGPVVVGMSAHALIALDPVTGRVVWELPGEYDPNNPSLATAGDVLYFQGSPQAKPAPKATGTLNALDLGSRTILWSFTRAGRNASWSFGPVSPVDGGFWTNHSGVLMKLEEAGSRR
jgi:outer membrane protein assembly factor BamB